MDEQPGMDMDDNEQPLETLAQANALLMAGEQPEHDRDERGNTVDIQFLREIMYALHAVSIGTHQLLYFSAMKYCKNYLDPDADTVDEAIDELTELFDAMNIGTLVVVDRTDSAITFALSDSAIAAENAGTDRPICYFISGYIAGYLENALDARYVVNEIACVSQGHETCEFKAQHR